MEDLIIGQLSDIDPITLEEMGSIRLMNRIDRKFVTNAEAVSRLLEICRQEYLVQDVDGERFCHYHTVYFDTEGHKFYFDHHNGRCPREKVRLRTYLDSSATYLEVKTKNNHDRTRKSRIRISSEGAFYREQSDPFLIGESGFVARNLHPAIENDFRRITLVNKAKTERLTIDLEIHYHNLETGLECDTDDMAVIELKRDGLIYSPIKDMLRQLRIKESGFSKYCVGTVLTNPEIKKNYFKNKLVRIRKCSLNNNMYHGNHVDNDECGRSSARTAVV